MTEKERRLALHCLKANSDYHSEICEECIKYPCSHSIQDDVTETIIKELEQESKAEGARGDIPLQQSVPKMPQPSERTEERTETHECDCISRKDIGLTNLEILMCNGDYKEALKMLLDKIEKAPSVTPQQKTGHWVLSGGYWRCSECKEKALLKLDKATGGYREYEPVRSKYCPECGAKMQEVKK